jgi:hypothetical protein
MSTSLYIIVWAVLAIVVLGMAIYRNILGIHEGALHISRGRVSADAAQAREIEKEETVERWGQWLTVIVLAYGLVLAVTYLYGILAHGTLMMR